MTPEQKKLKAVRIELQAAVAGDRPFHRLLEDLIAAAREAGAAERDAAWRARIVAGSEGWWTTTGEGRAADREETWVQWQENTGGDVQCALIRLPDEEGDRDE